MWIRVWVRVLVRVWVRMWVRMRVRVWVRVYPASDTCLLAFNFGKSTSVSELSNSMSELARAVPTVDYIMY